MSPRYRVSPRGMPVVRHNIITSSRALTANFSLVLFGLSEADVPLAHRGRHDTNKKETVFMQRFRIIVLAVVASIAFGAITAASATAGEGPFLKVTGTRLGAGETKAITVKQKGSFELGTGAGQPAITCTELAGTGQLVGSAVGTAGSSRENLTFKGCTVANNGAGCEVEKKEIKTGELENWLDKTNATFTAGENFLVGFKPVKGIVFVTVKFTGATCKFETTPIETGKGDLGVAGIADNEAQEPIKAESATETEGVCGLVEFPKTLLKTEFVEKEHVVSSVTEKLTAFGKNVTVFSGHAEVCLSGAAKTKWGIFSK
jgi:hypothetical protein